MVNRVGVPLRAERVVLSEVLPYEVPPMFSNRAFYAFLTDQRISFDGKAIEWPTGNKAVDMCVRLIFGFSQAIPAESTESGRQAINVSEKDYTIPFAFLVGRNGTATRTLSVPHPRNQVFLSRFYSRYSGLMLHYTSASPFSIRRPAAVSSYSYDDDQLHRDLRETWGLGIESGDKEPETFRSYFKYERYSNIYKFFESTRYQQFEKNYSDLLRLDVSKCFESIYTHSLAWAIYGKSNIKADLKDTSNRRASFAEEFDVVMQKLNYNETNGIIVGPEFSRIFAEIILQSVDVVVARKLSKEGLIKGTHYDIQRYVDDYFVFTDRPEDQTRIVSVIQDGLREYNLHLNKEKQVGSKMPDITPISIAKLRMSRLLDDTIRYRTKESTADDGTLTSRLKLKIRANTFITDYKTAIKETGVDPSDILNYTLSVVEKRVVRILKKFGKEPRSEGELDELVNALVALVKFSFFVYSASPKVNPTVKMSRIANHVVTFANNYKLSVDLKRTLFDSIYLEINQHLQKARLSENIQVENLYLLTTLAQLGREYLLPNATLLSYFAIEQVDEYTFTFKVELNHFAISTLLAYMERRSRYTYLRRSLEKHALTRIGALHRDAAERLLLVLDLVRCPWIEIATKRKILHLAGIKTNADRDLIISFGTVWFTKWNHFDLGKELDLKRNHEVY